MIETASSRSITAPDLNDDVRRTLAPPLLVWCRHHHPPPSSGDTSIVTSLRHALPLPPSTIAQRRGGAATTRQADTRGGRVVTVKVYLNKMLLIWPPLQDGDLLGLLK
jgi:hypothetical protein